MNKDTAFKHSFVLLYHREPYDDTKKSDKTEIKPNGIIPTLKSFFGNRREGVWICCKESGPSDEADFEEYSLVNDGNYYLKRIPLSPADISDFYHITSKEGFWPIIHSFPERFNSDSINWEVFIGINKKFAQAAVEVASEDAVFWIHDYNLWLVPFYIRILRPDANIAFYHHTPFPAPEIFNLIPHGDRIIKSLLMCDLCCFNIPQYVENFSATAMANFDVLVEKREMTDSRFSTQGPLGERFITRQLRFEDRILHLDAIPEGPDINLIDQLVSDQRVADNRIRIAEYKKDCKLIFSASRMDYTKGTIEMLMCYDRLLERRKDLHGKIVLCNVSVEPSAGMKCYRETREEIRRLAFEIDRKYASRNWKPLILFTSPFSFIEMISWYREAAIMWVTPLRDGMNLVCKEYVAAKKGQGGILVLSEFAGAAVELDGAVLTNPYYIDNMDEAIDTALSMAPDEEKLRMRKMYKKLTSSDIVRWGNQLKIFEVI